LRAFDESKPVVPALELASDSSAVLLLPVLVLPPPSRALLVSDTVVVLLPGTSPNRDGPLLTGWFCFWKPGAVRAPESNVGWKSLANWAHAIEGSHAPASAMSPHTTREHVRKLGTLAPCWRPHEKLVNES
jgi:hypothetical protein